MFRIASIIVIVLAVAAGLLIGTLNSEIAMLDLLWLRLEWPLGLIVLCAAAAGLLLGFLLLWLFTVLPLRTKLRKALRQGAGLGGASPLNRIDD